MIRDVLVVPSSDVPIRDLLRFRKEHAQQLLDFRLKLDEYYEKLKDKSPTEVKVLNATLFDRIKKDTDALERSSRFAGIRTVLSGIQAFSRITVPAAWAGVAISSGVASTMTALPGKWIELGVGGAAAVNLALYLMTPGKTANAERPFTYVYAAERKFRRRM